MTARELRDQLYGVNDDTEILVLNEDAPIKGAVPIENVLSLKGNNSTKLVLMYQSKIERKVRSNGY